MPVDPNDSRWEDVSLVKNYNPQRYDFHWNDDFTRFIPLPLKWWDDASYIAYQCGADQE